MGLSTLDLLEVLPLSTTGLANERTINPEQPMSLCILIGVQLFIKNIPVAISVAG